MDGKAIREKLLNRKLKIELLDVPIPGLPELDGEIYIMEISGQDMDDAKKIAMNANGILNESLSNAITIARSLIAREPYDRDGTIDRVFSDTDIDFIAGKRGPDGKIEIRGFGSTTILTLVTRVCQVSGLTTDFLKTLGTNLIPTPSIASPIA